MNTQEMNAYKENFAALISITDGTKRIKLSGSIAEKKEQLLKELGTVSATYEYTSNKKPRKARY
ncbi:hypothetical protein [Photobacterium leiognathi]|uniref:Uncharacterized protein n=1 Tax=Photobacterium leiognathi TaxID=553611 RepID=A0ABX5GCS2_PHOLE|nr:hypothetical protein [Photobacterium leiognathi]KJF89641.1 hypothetical protein UB42_12280 [Photobacterium leiognathi]PSV79370.1 hypothetical protein CTM94_16505 [Photobacterium leiognathi]